MKVGVDTFGCDHGKSGIGLYLMSLLANFPQDDNVVIELFGSELDKYVYNSNTRYFDFSGVSIPDSKVSEIMWHSTRAPSFVQKKNYDIVLYAGGVRYAPASYKTPGVIVVNEVISLSADYANPMYQWYIKKNLNHCTTIIASSQYVKKDLVSVVGVSADKIEIVYNGIDHSLFYPRTDLNQDYLDIQPFAIKRPYIIYASRLNDASKKHIELIKAFSLFKKKTGSPHRLVLAGSSGPYSSEIHKVCAESDFASDIFLTGYFPHESLPLLYSSADACIVPAVNEGVGLPVLEALACGVPVACSKSGSLPEVAGKHALYFDSDDIQDMASCIEQIITDETTRRNLAEGGIDWTKRFSWEKTGSRTLDVLVRAFKESR